MPRAGAVTLFDLTKPATLEVACEPCGRHGRYSVGRLIAAHGNETLPALLNRITKCPRGASAGAHDKCKARFIGL